jgi:hypothetical protein
MGKRRNVDILIGNKKAREGLEEDNKIKKPIINK